MIHATELLEASVYDVQGNYVGRVRELCIVPAEQSNRVGRLVISRGRYQPLVARHEHIASAAPGTVRLNANELSLDPYHPDEGWLTVRKDLLDQQIIDIHGRKVVRINDLSLLERSFNNHMELRVAQVDVGLGGALRRLFKGVLSPGVVRTLLKGLPTRVIPWELVDLIETDPMRRVKLKLPQSKLRSLHPADIADILEELAPAEREAVIEGLDPATAAEALGEVKDDLQVRILEEMDKERAADILEQMPPDEAADVLAGLSEQTAAEVLQDMDRKDATELVELLRYPENTAGALMTPELFASHERATVAQAVDSLRGVETPRDTFDTVYLISDENVLTGAVPVVRLLLAAAETPLVHLCSDQLVFADAENQDRQVIELFDKYNLRSLPVVDSGQKLIGVITVDDIVHRLWQKQA